MNTFILGKLVCVHHTSEIFLCSLSPSSCSLSHLQRICISYCHSYIVLFNSLTFLVSDIRGTIWYLRSCVWLISVHIMDLRHIHFPTTNSDVSFFIVELYTVVYKHMKTQPTEWGFWGHQTYSILHFLVLANTLRHISSLPSHHLHPHPRTMITWCAEQEASGTHHLRSPLLSRLTVVLPSHQGQHESCLPQQATLTMSVCILCFNPLVLLRRMYAFFWSVFLGSFVFPVGFLGAEITSSTFSFPCCVESKGEHTL